MIRPAAKILSQVGSKTSLPACQLSFKMTNIVNEAMAAKKLEYSRARDDFQEKGNAGRRHCLRLGIMAGVTAAQSTKAASNLSLKNRSSAKMILS